jgi:hypothetical protein
MLVLGEHFRELLGNVTPPNGRLQLARQLPPAVRDHLQEDEEFTTVEPHTLLIGSYHRSTAVGMLRDVDVLVLIANGDDLKPASVLLQLKRSLARMPGAARVDLVPQRRSVRVEFPDYDFLMDVVPARAPDGLDKPLLVPDRDQGKWLLSHPLGYANHFASVNDRSGDKIRPTVKLLKHWRDEQMRRRRPKSYLLEVLVAEQMSKLNLSGLGQAKVVHAAMQAVYQRCQDAYASKENPPRIADPMLGHSISAAWDRDSFETFMRRLSESIGRAERALSLSAEEHLEAVGQWQKVFGDAFPARVEDCPYCEGEAIERAHAAGALAVTLGATPRLTIGQTQNAIVVPRKARFWGTAGGECT